MSGVNAEGLHRVSICRLRFLVPSLDGGGATERPAFITHDTVGREARSEGARITSQVGGEVVGNRFGKNVLHILEGRWKPVILFHLFGGNLRRFSELRRAIPTVSEKMLIQQLRQMERDGIVRRFVHHQVPPKVEYSLTDWGQALCPALDALLKWVDLKQALATGVV
jgi:DNA-binding HxlR family transcriptional regulator